MNILAKSQEKNLEQCPKLPAQCVLDLAWGNRLTEEHFVAMHEFPEFMKQPVNRIASGSQATPGVEGYVFDGADASQMAFWTCRESAASAPHTHEFDEYMVVVEGCYTLILYRANVGEERKAIRAGEECLIPRGVRHGGEVVAGTRTIHAFGGHRANRIQERANH